MENFKEIAEKCLTGELSGTFITAFDNNWHSRYLQRYTIPGHEIPEQYVLGPGIIYNDIGQCTSNEKVKIVDFIPDTMKNFKEIAEKCLVGKLSGRFVLRDNKTLHSKCLIKMKGCICPYYIDGYFYSDNGNCYNRHLRQQNNDIIDFISDNMQKKIEIDIPEGKVPVMEQTEKGVVITWKDQELTYNRLYQSIYKDDKAISSVTNTLRNDTSNRFLTKINVLRKLINIRNYFGKPDNNAYYGWIIHDVGIITKSSIDNPYSPIFAEKEHAEQAIKMLGDELKYLFEPW